MNKKKPEKEHPFQDSLYMIKFVMKNEPMLFIVNLLTQILCELPWTVASTVLLREIIDTFTAGENFTRILYISIGFAAAVIIGQLSSTVFFEVIKPIMQEKLNYKLNSAIYNKASRMDLSGYDDPKFYNDFVLSMKSMDERIEETRKLVAELTTSLFTIGTVVTVIITIDPICLIMIASCLCIIVPLGKRFSKTTVQRTEAMTPFDRKNFYYWRVFYLADYAKEIRLNPVGKMIRKRYNDNITDRINTIKPFTIKQWLYSFFQESLPLTLVIYAGVTLHMGYKAIVLKTLSLGEFTAVFNSASILSSTVFSLTSWVAVKVRGNGLFIGKFRKFMSAPETIKHGEKKDVLEKSGTLELKNVSFTYPGNTSATLKNINLTIHPNEKIALVGYNGAGKTTLTNLLLHLYDVTDGEILLNGTNINEWNLDSYHENFSAVFQDYSLFGATVGENISMDTVYDEKRALDALKESGFRKELKKGTDTVLLNEFDENGMQFSGGEAQKIAIARAFYKKCAFAILDEPSANLDPQAEYELNEAIIRAAKDKTVIFISHRLSTTVMADKIYMFENGEIVESGSHEELMSISGKYSEMFRLQAEKYN